MQKSIDTIGNKLHTKCQVAFAPLCISSHDILASLIISVINVSFTFAYWSSSVTTVITLTDDRILIFGQVPEVSASLSAQFSSISHPKSLQGQHHLLPRGKVKLWRVRVATDSKYTKQSSLYIVDVPMSLSTLKALSWQQPLVLCIVAAHYVPATNMKHTWLLQWIAWCSCTTLTL